MPNGVVAVSPWTTSTFSIGTPSLSEISWAKVVSWLWPWLCAPVRTWTLPVGLNLICADSHWPTPPPSAPITREGPRPQASM